MGRRRDAALLVVVELCQFVVIARDPIAPDPAENVVFLPLATRGGREADVGLVLGKLEEDGEVDGHGDDRVIILDTLINVHEESAHSPFLIVILGPRKTQTVG